MKQSGYIFTFSHWYKYHPAGKPNCQYLSSNLSYLPSRSHPISSNPICLLFRSSRFSSPSARRPCFPWTGPSSSFFADVARPVLKNAGEINWCFGFDKLDHFFNVLKTLKIVIQCTYLLRKCFSHYFHCVSLCSSYVSSLFHLIQ